MTKNTGDSPTATSTLNFNRMAFAPLGSIPPAALPAQFSGYFVTQSNGHKLFDRAGDLAAFIVNCRRQGQFIVTAFRAPGHAERYMHSTTRLTERWLGIEDLRCLAIRDLIDEIRVEAASEEACTA